MTVDKVEYFESVLQDHARRGEIGAGLVIVTQELRSLFQEFSPADILLIIHVLSMIICGIVLTLILHYNTTSVNVWGRDKQWKVLEVVVYVVTGLWLIEKMLLGFLHVNTSVLYWAVFICSLLCLAFFCLFLLKWRMYNDTPVLYATDKYFISKELYCILLNLFVLF